MNSARQKLRREQIDRLLSPLRDTVPLTPPGGWIRAIRTSLGMSLRAFARRLELKSASTAHQLELAETAGTISIRRLRAAADALGCDVFITIVPRGSIQEMVRKRATQLATERWNQLAHSMTLEGQSVEVSLVDSWIQEEVERLLTSGKAELWE